MGFNSGFKGLNTVQTISEGKYVSLTNFGPFLLYHLPTAFLRFYEYRHNVHKKYKVLPVHVFRTY